MVDIKIQTRLGRDILTDVYPDEPPHKLAAYAHRYGREFPEIQMRRAATARYNCYGLAFASRRAWVQLESVRHVLQDDGYRRLSAGEGPLAGDIVLYWSEGTIEHVGVIIQIEVIGNTVLPKVMSKWGPGPEYLHSVMRTPFGTTFEFWTERP